MIDDEDDDFGADEDILREMESGHPPVVAQSAAPVVAALDRVEHTTSQPAVDLEGIFDGDDDDMDDIYA